MKKVTSSASCQNGFTIVELLVVIVVIGILATITVVSYTGISNKAIVSSVKSDLNSSVRQLKLFQVDNSLFPPNFNSIWQYLLPSQSKRSQILYQS